MTRLRVCVDVPDLEQGIAFYREALGLDVVRRFGDGSAELGGAAVPVDLLTKAPGTAASPRSTALRDYGRHWTPVHLDVEVEDLEAALRRAEAAGAVLERPIVEGIWGRMANLADPFGHGLCLLEFRGRGYDELLATPGGTP
jgi:catechol 2,3-dioxygenase-like lactoylglutathione lyase family enzyme